MKIRGWKNRAMLPSKSASDLVLFKKECSSYFRYMSATYVVSDATAMAPDPWADKRAADANTVSVYQEFVVIYCGLAVIRCNEALSQSIHLALGLPLWTSS